MTRTTSPGGNGLFGRGLFRSREAQVAVLRAPGRIATFDREPSHFHDACPVDFGPRYRAIRSRGPLADPRRRLAQQDREPVGASRRAAAISAAPAPAMTSVSMSSFRSKKWLGFIIYAVVRSFRPSVDGAANRGRSRWRENQWRPGVAPAVFETFPRKDVLMTK